jgi:hypothetical protein
LDKVEAAVRAAMNIIYEWMLLSIAFVMQKEYENCGRNLFI